MPYATPEIQRAYQREWMRRRRADYMTDKACVRCGSTTALEIHHRDPALKVSHAVWSWRQERRDVELAKCEVLCAACHDEHHLAPLRRPCGTARSYRNGCRCQACRSAQTARQRDYLARKRAASAG